MTGVLKVLVAPDTWVPVGGQGPPGISMHTGPSAPADPDIDLWWDTDEVIPTAITADAICQLRMSVPQSLANATFIDLIFDIEDLDPLGWHVAGQPTRITPNIAGWYQVRAMASLPSDTDYSRAAVYVMRNGANLAPAVAITALMVNAGSHTPAGGGTVGLIYMNGTTDFFSLQGVQTNASTNANAMNAVFTVEWMRAA